MTQRIVNQPPPVPNDRPAIQDLVIADIEERKRIGQERYGMFLQAFNGRKPLIDGYQEVLDLAQYLRQEVEERALVDAVIDAAVDWREAAMTVPRVSTFRHERTLIAAIDALLAAGGGR